MKGITFFLLLVSFSALYSQPIVLRDISNQYDFIIITVPEFVSACETLEQHKESVRGFNTLIVDTTQIFAEFDSSGTPQHNIRDFISYAGTFWQEPKPKYFLLVGDLSKVPSFSDILIFPPIPVDTAYTDYKYSINKFSNDSLISSFQIGRIPSKNEIEIQSYASKVIIYETDTAYSDWMNRNLFVKQKFPDIPRVQEYDQFANYILAAYPEYFNNYIYTESDSIPHAKDRDSVVNFINNNGINSLWLFGDAFPAQYAYYSILDTADINIIENQDKFFIVFFFLMQEHSFGYDNHSLVNKFLFDINAAIASVAPVGLTFFGPQGSFLIDLSRIMFGAERKSLGDAINICRNNNINSSASKRINLWGDPSIMPKYDIPAKVISGEYSPTEFSLYQNYPNPFNPSTTIKFALPVEGNVKINVYNTLGQLVETLIDGEMQSGYHEINFDASRLASGIYLYQLRAGENISTKKMLLVK